MSAETVQALLDRIDDVRLLRVLRETDQTTLKIVLLKMLGYTGKEIALRFGMDVYAVNMRIYRLRKKLKTFY